MNAIEALLDAKGRISFEDMNLINILTGYHHGAGGTSTSTKMILDDLIEAAEEAAPLDPQIAAAPPYLQSWNNQYNDILEPRWPNPAATYDDPGLTIFEEWYERILDEVFGDDVPPFGEIGPIHREYATVWASTLIHVLDGELSKLPLNYDYLNGEDKNTVITRVLKRAIDNLTAEFGPDMLTWLTPIRTTTFDSMGALPAPTMHWMNRGTYNHIAEMPRFSSWWKPPHAVNVIPPGQSGFVNYLGQPSPHAYDQLLLYETWTYKPMLFRLIDILRVAESWTFLTYP